MTVNRSFNISYYLLDANIRAGRGDSVAVIHRGHQTSYAELFELVDAFADRLLFLGIRPEERVCIALLDRLETIVSFLAIARIGAIALLVNPQLNSKETYAIISGARSRLVIAEASHLESLEAELKGELVVSVDGHHIEGHLQFIYSNNLKRRRCFTWENLMNTAIDDFHLERCTTYEDSPCYWLCTSGTTGQPKLAMHRHLDLQIIAKRYAQEVLKMKSTDRVYSMSPLFHTYGFGNCIAFPFSCGASCILDPTRPLTPSHVIEVMRTYKPTVVFGIPTMFNSIVQYSMSSPMKVKAPQAPSSRPVIFPDSLRIVVSAGEVLSSSLFEKYKSEFGIEILDGIGSTEAGHIYCSNRPGSARGGCSGTAVPGYELQLRDIDTLEVIKPERGKPCTGVLFVKSPSASIGYYCNHDKTRGTFQGEWLNTGDRYMAIDGVYSYMGRNDDMVKIRGEWVGVTDVDTIFSDHSLIKECASVGIDDPQSTHAAFIVLFIVPKDKSDISKLSIEALQEFCIDKCTESIKIPSSAILVDGELPKSPVGKLLRTVLRDHILKPSLSKLKVIAAPANIIASNSSSSHITLEPYYSLLQKMMHVHEPTSNSSSSSGHHSQLNIKLKLEELGIDSGSIPILQSRIRGLFGVEIPVSVFYDCSVEIIGQYIVQSAATSVSAFPVAIPSPKQVNWNLECVLPDGIPHRLQQQRNAVSLVVESPRLSPNPRARAAVVFASASAPTSPVPEHKPSSGSKSPRRIIASESVALSSSSRAAGETESAEAPESLAKSGKRIFLTGATGFLGVHVLCVLLSSTNVETVHVLVRPANSDNERSISVGADAGSSSSFGSVLNGDPRGRLLDAAAKYRMSEALGLYWHKIALVSGNLDKKLFGLSEAAFDVLASKIDVVVHNGAAVNWIKSYDSLKPTNVGATIEVIRLCATGDVPKRLVFVSSIAAYLPHERFREYCGFSCDDASGMDALSGYGASKRVASRLVQMASAAGLDAVICSPGTIGGSWITGACNPSDAINRFLKGLCELRLAPNCEGVEGAGAFSIAPVEYVSAVVASLALLAEDSERGDTHNCYTVVGPGPAVSLGTVVDVCRSWTAANSRTAGDGQIALVSPAEFARAVADGSSSLTPLANFFPDNPAMYPISNEVEQFDHANTLAWCEKRKLRSPEIDAQALWRYLTFLMGDKRSGSGKKSSRSSSPKGSTKK